MLHPVSNVDTFFYSPEILHEIHDGVFICNAEGRILFINRAGETIFKVKAADWLGRHVAELIPNSVIYRALITQTRQDRIHSSVKDKNFIVDASPVLIEGKVVGAISTFKDDQEVLRLTKAYENLKKYVSFLKNNVEHSTVLPFPFYDFIVAHDSPMVGTIMQINKAATTDIPILLRGESGVGKEILAKAIHDSSGRKGTFVTVNCAAIPEALLESELFGYEEGAFTGAKKNGKKGKFELAAGGSIFLDEIGDMDYHMQAKLLRVLQQKELVRVGGTVSIPLDVRIITATHQNLERMIAEEKFREDLYYRINGMAFEIPPLRERNMDIEALIRHYTNEFSNKYERKFIIGEAAKRYMRMHPLRGNVRELKQAIEYAVIMCENEEIKISDFPKSFVMEVEHLIPAQKNPPAAPEDVSGEMEDFDTLKLNVHTERLEKKLIAEALKRSGNNHTKAIQMLGISRQTFYHRLKKIR